jgi:uracil phosphoribosyltransferase
MSIHVTEHPLIQNKLTVLRNQKTSNSDFRSVMKEVTFYLGYEATRNLPTKKETITTGMSESYDGSKISASIAIIPILRAGLGMGDAMLELLPNAAVHHIGE